jgi:hypothetical protein
MCCAALEHFIGLTEGRFARASLPCVDPAHENQVKNHSLRKPKNGAPVTSKSFKGRATRHVVLPGNAERLSEDEWPGDVAQALLPVRVFSMAAGLVATRTTYKTAQPRVPVLLNPARS